MEKSDLLEIFKDKHLRLTILPLVFATLFLISGTYAWFTYFSDVNSSMSGHVIGWNIDFSGESEIEDQYDVTIDKIYPGMEDFNSELVISNSGEASAVISYEIREASILGTTYKIGDVIDDIELNSEGLYKILTENYPFKFNFEITDNVVDSGENSSFKVSLIWPFETYIKVSETDIFDEKLEYYLIKDGEYIEENVSEDSFSSYSELYYINDLEDTYWGEKATEFKTNNPDEYAVKLIIEISASQLIEE